MRVKHRRLLAALAAGAAVLVAAGAPAMADRFRGPVVDPVRTAAALRWQEVTAAFERSAVVPDQLYVAADAAAALADRVSLSGWESPEVPGLVGTVIAAANADGGYGLARAWDAYQDGTVNPAATSYTATTAGHVGPILLAGYLAGAVPASVVNRMVDWVLDLPHPDGDACIPYSSSPYDLGRACVWNVHYGAAAWVKRASAATGHRRDDATALVARAASMLASAAPDPGTGYLPYSSAHARPQDIGHQIWTSASIDYLRGNADALRTMITQSLWRDQARRFHDYNVASAMSAIAIFDCRYATDSTVLRYAGSTERGNPYVFKSLAAQARQVTGQCFAPPGPGSSGALGTDRRSRLIGGPVPAGLG